MPEKQYFTGIDIINAPRIESLTVTEDGTYTASSDVIGYNPVVVNTNQPWQPLEDGYSNFWFELTDDTLSPWLNFSAKNNDAVIDWGDGSGEVALDTLTPTHTYIKAGRYVVKVKGVTEIARQMSYAAGQLTPYTNVCKAIELSTEVVGISATYAFLALYGLKHFVSGTMSDLGRDLFQQCFNLETLVMPLSDVLPTTFLNGCANLTSIDVGDNYTSIGDSAFIYCRQLRAFTIPSGVTSIGNTAFSNCTLLSEIHCQATIPPTLGNNVFVGLPANWICYVPVGTGDTYKAASGWSAYADHILEEGQTPNRAMLSRLAKAVETDTEEMR